MFSDAKVPQINITRKRFQDMISRARTLASMSIANQGNYKSATNSNYNVSNLRNIADVKQTTCNVVFEESTDDDDDKELKSEHSSSMDSKTMQKLLTQRMSIRRSSVLIDKRQPCRM